jgi:AcrR family transcriptional regulator
VAQPHCGPRSVTRRARSADDARQVVPQGISAPESIPADVFAAAADSYLAGQRLEMQALARKLDLSRATLYRRAGNRQQLLDEIIWWRSRRMLVSALRCTAELRGTPRIVAVIGAVLRAVQGDRALRAFLEADPETALRILTGTRGTVQAGMTRALESLIDLERERGDFAADLDTPTLAYAIIRISQGFLYSDIIADHSPDIARAGTVIEALLRGLDTARRR